jgi:hypothetical protein
MILMSIRQRITGVGIVILLWIASSLISSAQRITGDIVGTVTDSSGSAIPNTKVILRSLDTGRQLETSATGTGDYSFVELKPGRYEVLAESPGFARKAVSGVTLSADQRSRVDIALSVGLLTTEVEVQASGGKLVQTEASDLSAVVENRRVVDLPLNGRSYLSLALTTPGVIMGGSQGLKSNTSNFTLRNNQSIWVSGQRESGVNYIIDGIETRNSRWASVSFRPSIDMISEFKVQRNAYGGEMGVDGGTIVNITTKGGTNQIHGTVFEFLKNDDLTARNFFDNDRAPLRENDFGAGVGGPLVKNKLFFFASYEGDRNRKGQTLQGLFPSRAQFQGNLADDSNGTGILPTNATFCAASPQSTKCKNILDPGTRLPFPNNVIPASRISNFARKFIDFLPEANALERLSLGVNRLANPSIITDWNQWSVRVDHNISNRDTAFYRYIWVNEPLFQPSIRPGGGFNVPLEGRNFAAGWTRSISAKLVNTFHAGWNKGVWQQTAEFAGGSVNYPQLLGLLNTSDNPLDWQLPGVSLVGYSGLGGQAFALGNTDENIQFNDTLIYYCGNHNLRFGGEYRYIKYFDLSDSPGSPQLTFNGNFTGSSIGDYLLGIPSAASGFQGVGASNWRQNLYAFYASDSYRVRPSFTLNIGMGWEYKSPIREIDNQMALFDFQQLKLLLAGKDFSGTPVDPFHGGYKPQLGFAWRPFGASSTVIRSGFGIYWQSQKSNDVTQGISQNPPFIFKPNFTAGATPTLSTETLFPPIDVKAPIPTSVELSTRLKHEKPPYSPEWNFTVEHQFARNWLLQVSYQGASLIRGGVFEQGNPAAYDPTGRIPIQTRRLYPQVGDIKIATTSAHGYYHAGTLMAKKRFSSGFSLDAHYTVGRSIDDSTNEINNTDFPLIGRKLDRGPSDIDIRHMFVASYVYELPVGKGRRFLSRSSAGDAILGGWQVSGITSFMSGPPDKVVLPGNWLNTGSRISARPDCVSDPNQSRFRDSVRSNGLLYFDTAAFQLPAMFTPGNCGRNVLRSPGINNWDMAIQKHNRLGERLSLQTRFEFFNSWNHTQWQIFSGRSGGGVTYGRPGFGSASFGRVTAARDSRLIQLAMKLMF